MDSKNLPLVKRWSLFLMSSWLVVFAANSFSETFVQGTVESRVILAFHANTAVVQQFLPSPWKLKPVAKGPLQGANLFVVFGDRAFDQDATGKPRAGGISRFTAFAVPATNSDNGKSGAMVLRIFVANSRAIPGAYKTNVLASVSREFSYSGEDMEFGVVEDKWLIEARDHADIRFAIRYNKSLPSRSDREFDVYSSVEPNFYRIYRVDQGTDVVMSKPKNIDRLLDYDARINVPEFKGIFDGSEELISVAVLPWYVRKVFLP